MKTKVYFVILTIMSAFGLQAQTIMNIHQSNGTVLQIPLNTIDSITYTIPNLGNLATLTTTAVSAIAETTAISGGNITNDGGSLITQRGVCYSTSPLPTTANTSTISGSGVGSFTSNFIGLTANTTYYVRAYASNSVGTAYGNELTFTTNAGGGGIVSNPGAGVTFDGYIYASIVLGNGQEWMAENLRTTVYANGDAIPEQTNSNYWGLLQTPAWAYYNNSEQLDSPFGKLYNWYTVADTRNVCPAGWHIPSDPEWNQLIEYLDPLISPDTLGAQSTIAGSKMKSMGTQYWQAPNTDATNESGFNALPGGERQGDGLNDFIQLNSNGHWWSSSLTNSGSAWYRSLSFDDGHIYRWYSTKRDGKSLRCLRD